MDGGVGHTAWAPEGREGRSQAGPKVQKPTRRAAKTSDGTYIIGPFLTLVGKASKNQKFICRAKSYPRWISKESTFGLLLLTGIQGLQLHLKDIFSMLAFVGWGGASARPGIALWQPNMCFAWSNSKYIHQLLSNTERLNLLKLLRWEIMHILVSTFLIREHTNAGADAGGGWDSNWYENM